MATEIKFCGLTRAEDARKAASLGAAYVGVIFAPGPRRVTGDTAAAVLDAIPSSIRRVGVFADSSRETILTMAAKLSLDVVQLHGEYQRREIDSIKTSFPGQVWSVLRLLDGRLPASASILFGVADAVLLEAHVPGKLGGTGVALPWREVALEIAPLRKTARGKLVLAGGLLAENVAEAIRLLRPDVVDVSSGVETAPGIKDHARMRAFRDAVHAST